MNKTDDSQEPVDALCRECGHAFKIYIDRLLPEEKPNAERKKVACPICGCGDCSVGK